MPGSDDGATPPPGGASNLVATSVSVMGGDEEAAPHPAIPVSNPSKRPGGRPPRLGGPTPKAEIQRAYRARRKAAGKVIKVLDADTFADLTMVDRLRERLRGALGKLGRREQDVAQLESRNAYLQDELKRLAGGRVPEILQVILEAAPANASGRASSRLRGKANTKQPTIAPNADKPAWRQVIPHHQNVGERHIYEVFDQLLLTDTWDIASPKNTEHFNKVLDQVVYNPAFNAEALGDYIYRHFGIARGARDDSRAEAIERLTADAWAIRRFLNDTGRLLHPWIPTVPPPR